MQERMSPRMSPRMRRASKTCRRRAATEITATFQAAEPHDQDDVASPARSTTNEALGETLVPKVDIQAHAPTVWAFGRMSEDAVVLIHTGSAGICSVGN